MMKNISTPATRTQELIVRSQISERMFADMCGVMIEDIQSVLIGRTLPDRDMLVALERRVTGATDMISGEWDGKSMYEDFENGDTDTRWEIFRRYGVPSSLYPTYCDMVEEKRNAPAEARRKSIELIEWSLPSLSDAKISQIISLINSPEN